MLVVYFNDSYIMSFSLTPVYSNRHIGECNLTEWCSPLHGMHNKTALLMNASWLNGVPTLHGMQNKTALFIPLTVELLLFILVTKIDTILALIRTHPFETYYKYICVCFIFFLYLIVTGLKSCKSGFPRDCTIPIALLAYNIIYK